MVFINFRAVVAHAQPEDPDLRIGILVAFHPNSHLERERERESWNVLRAVSRSECEMVRLSFFEVAFQPGFLLQRLIIQ